MSRQILAIALVGLLIGSLVLPLIPIPVQAQKESLLALTKEKTALFNTKFKIDGTISIDNNLLLDVRQDANWTKATKFNSTHIQIHQTDTNKIGDFLSFVCAVNLSDRIKCDIIGKITTPRRFLFGVSGGSWDSPIYSSDKFKIDFSDVIAEGFPITLNEAGQLDLLLFGNFVIDPTITTVDSSLALENEMGEKAFTLSGRDYVFYTDSNDDLFYQFKQPSETAWGSAIRFAGVLLFDQRAFATNSNGTHVSIVRGRTAGALSYILAHALGDGTLQVDQNTSITHTGTAVSYSTDWNSTGYPITSYERQNFRMQMFRSNDINGATWFAQLDTDTGGSAVFGVGTFICGLSNGNLVLFGYDTFSGDSDFESRIWYAANHSFGTIHLVEDVGASPVIYSGTCEGTTAHLFYTAVNLGSVHYVNITTGGNPSTPITVINSAVDSLAITADENTGSLLFLTIVNGKVIYNETSSNQVFRGNGTLQTGIVGGTFLHSPRHFNGTAPVTDLFLAYMNNSATINYVHWTNTTIDVTFSFYDTQGSAVIPSNMSLFTANHTYVAFDTTNPTTLRLNTGSYNVTEIFNGDGDKKDNSSAFYVGQAFNSLSFIVHNVTVILTFLDEVTEDPYTKVKVVEFHLPNEVFTVNVSTATTLTQGLAQNPEQIRISVSDGTTTFDRWRQIRGSAFTHTLNIYLPDHDIYTVRIYDFTLFDPAKLYGGGRIQFNKTVTVGDVIISEQQIDLTDKPFVALIQGHKYTIRTTSADGSEVTDLGFIIPNTDTSLDLTVSPVTFARDLNLTRAFFLWDASRNGDRIIVNYTDLQGLTNSVNVRIFNASGLQYNQNFTSQTFQINATFGDSNRSHVFFVEITIDHQRFGIVVESKTLGNTVQNLIDLGIDNIWYVYFAIAFIIFITSFFGPQLASMGTIITGVMVGFMFFIGWLSPMPAIGAAVIVLLGFLFGLGSRRSVN